MGLVEGQRIKTAPAGASTMTISIDQAALNLAVALGLSAVIGFERQWRNRLARLRTNTLVALGAASFVIFERGRNVLTARRCDVNVAKATF